MSDTVPVLLVRADNTVTVLNVEVGDADRLRTLIGGWLEGIYDRSPRQLWCGFVDEEGRLNNRPSNRLASIIAAGYGRLVGDVVFCGPIDNHGDITAVSPTLVTQARELAARL